MELAQRLVGACLKAVLKRIDGARLPQASGRVYARDIGALVEIRRDRWGVPHVRAASRQDLFFAQGYVHAQDRLWQMELNRRAAKGELAAVVGQEGLEIDRLSRTLGFSRMAKDAWQSTSQQVRDDVRAYVAGINGYLAGEPTLAVEFELLRFRPEPWDPLDSVAYGRLIAWSLSHGWASKLLRAQMIERCGPEPAGLMEPQYPKSNPVTLPRGIEYGELQADGMLRAASGPFLGRGEEGIGRGSNGWVISAERSATGHAILCNDMHLPLTVPSLWYHVHLFSEDEASGRAFHVAGASMPGLPYVLVGHNERIAWGATLSLVDTEDLFVEKLLVNGSVYYLFKDDWRPATVIEERIEIRGKSPHVERVVVTHHGPIISPELQDEEQPLALQSMALQSSEAFEGFALLNEATDWPDFVRAVGRIESPSLNLIYADVEDNIGYYVSGRVPQRARGQGLVPSAGWTGEFEWIGTVPFEEMPHAFNPEQGYLVTANQRIVDDDYPHYLGRSWRNGYRSRRIGELIEAIERISVADCQRFQTDLKSLPGSELVARLADVEVDSPNAALALELLRSWDGWLDSESVGGAVFELLVEHLCEATLGAWLGDVLLGKYLGIGPHSTLYPVNEFHGHRVNTLLRLLDDAQSPLWPSEMNREAVLNRCLVQTVEALQRTLGSNPTRWHWGRLHKLSLNHALAVRWPLAQVFCHGPVPIGGDADTVAQASIAPEGEYEAIGPSYRQIIDLGNLGASLAIHAPGQSGHLGSHHAADLLPLWLNGGYFPISWEEDEVLAASKSSLTLSPPILGS